MNYFDLVKDKEGKEYLMIDDTDFSNDEEIGNCEEDFEILKILGKGSFGEVYKVLSKKNNKIYAMKRINLNKFNDEKIKQLNLNEIKFLEKSCHPHIINLYKSFENINNNIFMIIDYMENGDLTEYIDSYKFNNKIIPEEIIWDIILQCMSGLAFIHSIGVIHRDIKPGNILLDNNMSLKIGDFGVSALLKDYHIFNSPNILKCNYTEVGTPNYKAPEIIKHSPYTEKIDIYSMGVTFFELCYFITPKTILGGNMIRDNTKNLKKVPYSKELLSIINLMIEENDKKRPTSEEALKMFKDEYSKKYIKNSSVDSILRCLYSFDPLTNFFLSLKNVNIPFSKAYIQCLESVRNPKMDAWINSINILREILGKKNIKLEGAKEIDPRIIFSYIINYLHKELNNPQKLDNNKDKNDHLFKPYEESRMINMNKVETMLNFLNNFVLKFNSIISNNFMGTIKEKRFCNNCKGNSYLFRSYFLVTFNLEQLIKNNKNKIIDIKECFEQQNGNEQIKTMFCNKCFGIFNHYCYNFFYSVPKLLVISIHRGYLFQYKNPINIEEKLDITKYVEIAYSNEKTYQYHLIGLIKRKIKDNKECYFSIIYIDQGWYMCEGRHQKKVNSISKENFEGDIIMLFYQLIKV